MFIVRIGLSLVFMIHGLANLMDITGTVDMFLTLQLSGVFGYLIIVLELLGGILLLLGFFIRFIGLVFSLTMILAIFLVKSNLGFVNGFELEFVILIASLATVIYKPRKFTLQETISRRFVA